MFEIDVVVMFDVPRAMKTLTPLFYYRRRNIFRLIRDAALIYLIRLRSVAETEIAMAMSSSLVEQFISTR